MPKTFPRVRITVALPAVLDHATTQSPPATGRYRCHIFQSTFHVMKAILSHDGPQ